MPGLKIGIATQCGLWNYGNHLQNYAMQKILSGFGEAVTLVNTYDILKKNVMRARIKSMLGGRRALEAERLLKFYNFCKKNLAFEKFDTDKCAHSFDYVVCGSDQIWSPELSGTPYDFALFMPPEKRISYAASFGVSEIPDEKKPFFTDALKEMKALSVREEKGAEIIKNLTGRNAEVHIDPTLMLDKNNWCEIESKPHYETAGNFLLTYFIGEIKPEHRRYINNIAEKNNLKIINIEHLNPNEYWYKTGPAEFLWLIEHSRLICTDSFHGSAFSVIMGVPFVVFERKDGKSSMYSRIDTLLKKLNLDSRKFESVCDADVFSADYSKTQDILKGERRKSAEFFSGSLGNA